MQWNKDRTMSKRELLSLPTFYRRVIVRQKVIPVVSIQTKIVWMGVRCWPNKNILQCDALNLRNCRWNVWSVVKKVWLLSNHYCLDFKYGKTHVIYNQLVHPLIDEMKLYIKVEWLSCWSIISLNWIELMNRQIIFNNNYDYDEMEGAGKETDYSSKEPNRNTKSWVVCALCIYIHTLNM